MTPFAEIHADRLLGELNMCDRILFKGHLTHLYWPNGFLGFLCSMHVRLKDFKQFVVRSTEQIVEHGKAIARAAGRPYLYLDRPMTAKTGQTKEDLAKRIAERDGVKDGLIAVFSTLEPCTSFRVQGNGATQRLEVRWARRRCLFLYFYFIDRELGFMHVRLQTWFPLEMQVYVNGHEWLARQLDRLGIPYTLRGNAFTAIDDIPTAQKVCERFFHREWHRVLDAFARRVNPFLPVVEKHRYGSYYWSIDQAEFSTDLMFRTRYALEEIMPDLFRHALVQTGARDVLKFLDRKMNGHFQGDVTTRIRHRPECVRIKHTMTRNAIKMYDKGSVLRIETTINNPREFKVFKSADDRGNSRRWRPMGKGVANFWRYTQVGFQSNARYLEALASARLNGEAIHHLDRLCRSTTKDGVRHAGFQPLSRLVHDLFRAVLNGSHIINGFRNKDIRALVYTGPSRDSTDSRRRCGQVSRLIRKLRAHGLIAKVPLSRLYRVTPLGHAVMGAAVKMRDIHFPNQMQAVA